MQAMQSDTRRGAGIGIVLIVIGLLLFAGQQLTFHIDWPVWPIAVGIGLFVAGLLVGHEGGVGFAIAGGIVTTVGVVLGVQQATDSSGSWAYAWALVAPGGVGLGMSLYGLLTGQGRFIRSGLGALTAGIALFLVGFVFFEGFLGLGNADQQVVSVVVPALIVILGLLLLVGAFVAPRFWRADSWEASGGAGWTPAGPARGPVPGAAAAAAAAGEAAEGAAARATGAAAEAAGGPATQAAQASTLSGDDEDRSIDLGDATMADVTISFGAGVLTITGPAGPGHLVDGTFRGGARLEGRGPGRIRLATPADRMWSAPWDRAPFEWRIGLTDAVPLRLALEGGASKTVADLSALRVTDLRVKSGASDTTITVPATTDYTRVDAEAGVASLRFIVPPGVAARISSKMGLGSTDVDMARFPRDPSGGWISPDWATARHRVEFDLRGGVGSVSVR